MRYITGRKPVLEALNSPKSRIGKIYIRYGIKGEIIDSIYATAKKRGIKVTTLDAQRFDAEIQHKENQGVAALIEETRTIELNSLINLLKEKKDALLVIAESIQDPHNLGAIMRSAECAGADGILITKFNSAPLNETVSKASAGAMNHLRICQINNLAHALDELKKNGYWIAGTAVNGENLFKPKDYNLKLAVIAGNEEKGIRKLTAENCDFLLNIPMKGKIQSLNVSVATAIVLFEINRQRENHL
ncbi:MAG: 23S rRNA (guanosine(2251)-2'-O)-methyltransferase RlmB [Ignavibacteriaceae bacterium]|nr:23S rRNA (guanosine(2251)-2'-O)-methyltransferase RlmB [Ignavibacteriaceae bacterium]